MLYVPAVLKLIASAVVPVISPAQLSIAIGASTVSEQAIETLTTISTSGAVTSLITTVCSCVTLPALLVNVQITVYVPCSAYETGFVVVPVIVPLSAVGAVNATAHSSSTAGNAATSGTGNSGVE